MCFVAYALLRAVCALLRTRFVAVAKTRSQENVNAARTSAHATTEMIC